MKKHSKTSNKKQPANRRAKSKFPAFKPSLNLKSRYEEIMDVLSYVDQLNEEEKKWLHSFVEEYINANMKHKGKKLHRTKAERKICFDKNNARNVCTYTKSKAGGKVLAITEAPESTYDDTDNMIERIDTINNYLSWSDFDESDDGNDV